MKTIPREAFTAAIDRARDGVIDADIIVDDARAELERAVDALRAAVRERDRAIQHLCHLIGWARLEAA
jgi:hypothetical protein